MIRMMVGRAVDPLYGARPIPAPGSVAREVEGVPRHGTARVRRVDLDRRLAARSPGRNLGLAGLVGAGRTEFARAVFGADPFLRGSIDVDGVPVRSLAARCDPRGIGLVPEDRKMQALFLSPAVRSNFSIAAPPVPPARHVRA